MGFGAVGIWGCFRLRGFKVPEVTPTSQYEDPVVVAVVQTVRGIVSLNLSRGLRFLSYPPYSGWAFPTPAGHSQSNTVFPNLHDSTPLANRVPVKCRAPESPMAARSLLKKHPSKQRVVSSSAHGFCRPRPSIAGDSPLLGF